VNPSSRALSDGHALFETQQNRLFDVAPHPSQSMSITTPWIFCYVPIYLGSRFVARKSCVLLVLAAWGLAFDSLSPSLLMRSFLFRSSQPLPNLLCLRLCLGNVCDLRWISLSEFFPFVSFPDVSMPKPSPFPLFQFCLICFPLFGLQILKW
jgi:hypothetical protein